MVCMKEVLTVASRLQASYVGAARTQPQAHGKQQIVGEFGLELVQGSPPKKCVYKYSV